MSDIQQIDSPDLRFFIRLASNEMRMSHWVTSAALWERAPLTQREIGELLSLDPATVSPLVRRLEAGGLVQRQRHPDDERALQVTLTPRGAGLRAQALLVPPQIIERLGMEVEQLQALHGSLTRVIAASRDVEETP